MDPRPQHVRPGAGPWPDDSWKEWWGDTPLYHTSVLVLTNHARDSFIRDGGTTFHFVTDGIHPALRRAREAANGQDVRLGGIGKRLTAITVVIMVPSFVASIYGMNFANMLPPGEIGLCVPPIVASSG